MGLNSRNGGDLRRLKYNNYLDIICKIDDLRIENMITI